MEFTSTRQKEFAAEARQLVADSLAVGRLAVFGVAEAAASVEPEVVAT